MPDVGGDRGSLNAGAPVNTALGDGDGGGFNPYEGLEQGPGYFHPHGQGVYGDIAAQTAQPPDMGGLLKPYNPMEIAWIRTKMAIKDHLQSRLPTIAPLLDKFVDYMGRGMISRAGESRTAHIIQNKMWHGPMEATFDLAKEHAPELFGISATDMEDIKPALEGSVAVDAMSPET